MTEHSAGVIALTLTIELAVAIGCAVAWLAAREVGENDLSGGLDRSAVGDGPEFKLLSFPSR